MRVSYLFMIEILEKIFLKLKFSEDDASKCAELFAKANLDGVYSHGINRVQHFINNVNDGYINPFASPLFLDQLGAIERYDGQSGAGNLNAHFATNRAIQLAEENGIGMVTMSNSNHWIRGGAYGWQAAEAGYICICWSNTESLMPSWGSKTMNIGNNPLVVAIPRLQGHIVLDMALSQFSYGNLQLYENNKEKLPVHGGYDSEGELTDDPAHIKASSRLLPMGFWKGSGLAIALDMMAAVLSGGNPTFLLDEYNSKPGVSAHKASQIFIVIKPSMTGSVHSFQPLIDEIISNIHTTERADGSSGVYYPGERTILARQENLELGCLVDCKAWESLLAVADH
ncbi:3-dehydro-L-gulonate 2-dehydrogenase [Paenibacillus sp. L3-i20]|uniref:3-dehydro-L-gulonate 2-dehydrogenase n=1 Tax=Paenibacillus sp. L3-i20 TaxID=2905833 RepID=UPI001EDF2ACF|nr:3-dehydro-L-gulonate 2-dehydrogenase [Paenibacillus sp. L3-i20]GKU79388.1 2,3-diketo-L-gulonate reductase [Paenibacillus sp. L3-i20]